MSIATDATLGATIRDKRRQLGYTQLELAQILDVPSNSIARWERNEVIPLHPRVLLYALDMLLAQRQPRTTTPQP